ncbi:hypothetical protein L7F22_050662 [Adiantum nelumboides]|nr:hypothetical protein [Adiantum nelumboides]
MLLAAIVMVLLLDFDSLAVEARSSSRKLNSPYSKFGSSLDTSSLTPNISSPTPNTTTTPAVDVTTNCKLRTNLAGHSGYVNNVTISPDGSLCVSSGQDVVAMLWDLAKGSKSHGSIGFITFESSNSVMKVMAETHELGGSTVAVDEATFKNEGGRSTSRSESYERYHEDNYLSKYYDREYNGAYGAYSPYIVGAGVGGSQARKIWRDALLWNL